MSDLIAVEVAFTTPTQKDVLELQLPAGASVADALNTSAARRALDSIDNVAAVGVWGRVVERSHELRDGDRVEVYRPLMLDPREARRQCAAAGVTMAVGAGRSAGVEPHLSQGE